MTSARSNLSFSAEWIPLDSDSTAEAAGNSVINAKAPYSGCVRVGQYLYLMGNIPMSRRVLSHTVAVLNVETKTWKFVSCEGHSAEGAGVFLYQDSLFSLNARDHLYVRSGKLNRFDLALNEWTYIHTVGDGPKPRHYFADAFLEKLNRYVVFGGYTATNDNNVYLLDMPERRWAKAQPSGKPPSSRFQCGSCVHNGLMYIYGGWAKGYRCKDGLFILKVRRDHRVIWSSPRTNARVIGPMSSFAFIPVGGILLICGGVL